MAAKRFTVSEVLDQIDEEGSSGSELGYSEGESDDAGDDSDTGEYSDFIRKKTFRQFFFGKGKKIQVFKWTVHFGQ